MKRTALVVCTLAALLPGRLVVPAAAQTYTELGASPPEVGLTLGSFAYDDKHAVHLHVFERNNGNGTFDVLGRFINANGTVAGIPFVISANRLSFGLRPRVAYSRGSGADVFLVTYIADQAIPNKANAFAQLVRYTGAAPTGGQLVGTTISLSPNTGSAAPSVYQLSTDVAFNPITSQFLTAWEEYPGPDVMVRLINADGSPATAANYVTAGPGAGGQGAPAIAFDWQRNRFLAVFTGDNPIVSGSFGVYSYLLDGSTTAVLSALQVLQVGFNIEPAVAYLPERDGFLAAWTGVTAGPRTSNARFVGSTDTAATLPDQWYPAMFSTQNVGAPSLDYDNISRRVLMGSMRALDPAKGVIAGTIFDAFGTPLTGIFNMSTVPATVSGTYYPTVRSAAGGIVGMAYVNDYVWANFERYLFPAHPNGPGPIYNCQGNCTPPPPPPPPPPPLPKGGDFTGDGKLDIVWENTSGQVYLWGMDGITFTGTGTYLWTQPITNVWQVVGTADFNGDNQSDILWQNQVTGQPYLYFYNGTTWIGEQALTLAAGSPWRIMGTGDFNKDGKADIAWQNVASGQMYVWFMAPSGGFSAFQGGGYIQNTNLSIATLPPNTSWRIVGTGDVNQDTHIDLLWQDLSTGSLTVWYLQGLIISGFLDVPLNDPRRVKAVGDYNADGRPDLIVQGPSNNVEAWFLTPSTLSVSAIWGSVNPIWSVVGAR